MLKQKTIALATLTALTFTLPMVATAQEKALTKADVEGIIKEVIQKDPSFILEAVDNYQRKTMGARQAEALGKNKDMLFKNDDSPVVGSDKADVTIVEFFDYNCGYCKRALPDIEALMGKDKNIRFVFKELPILGPSSETAAKWALAAHNQKKYMEYHRELMQNRSPINDDLLEGLAKKLGMDVAKAKSDANGSDIAGIVAKNRALAEALNIRGTPAFVIGDEIIPGAISAADMEKKVAEYRKAVKK